MTTNGESGWARVARAYANDERRQERDAQRRAEIWGEVPMGVEIVDGSARAEAQERSEAEEQRSLEIERERSRRPPDPPDLPDPPPRHEPLGQPVIDRDGTYL